MSREKSMNHTPNHVAVILDGNRRFAKRLMRTPWRGHELGAGKVRKLLRFFKDLEITELTLYALSVDNIDSRPKNELDMLFRIFRNEFRNLDREELERDGIRIKFVGNLDLLPKDLAKQCRALEKATENHSSLTVNFAIAYGGREEILYAVKNILKNKLRPEDLDMGSFESYLYMSSEPDLIIRTGGEKRTSNFLPWQGTYSEWIFLDKMWPEFDKEDLKACIEEFSRRKRNFGG